MTEASSTTSPLATFQFSTIGKTPALLNRLSDAQNPNANNSRSPSPVSVSKAPASSIPSISSRKSLLEALGGFDSQPAATPTASFTQQYRDTSHTLAFASSGTSTRQAPNGEVKASSVSNGKQHQSPSMNGTPSTSQSPAGERSYSPATNSGSVPSRPALLPLSNSANTGFPTLSALSPNVADQSPPEDDALDGFRRALERLRAEDAQYLSKAEETRFAMARQQDQAARWHARADALFEQLSTLYAQCERKIASANQVIAEFERLQGLVQHHEADAREKDRALAALQAKNAELSRGSQDEQSRVAERQRLVDAHTAELRQVAERAVAEKVDLENRVQASTVRMDALERQLASSGERERALEASLVDHQRIATQEKKELIAQVEEQKRLAELEKQMRLAGLEADKLRRDGQARADREEKLRTRIAQDRVTQSSGSPTTEPPSTNTTAPPRTSPPSQPTVAPAVGQKSAAHVLTSSAPTKITSSSPPTSTQSHAATNQSGASRHRPQSPTQGTKSLVIPPADRQPALGLSASIKHEHATPHLKTAGQASAAASQRVIAPETPTTKVKPEPRTIGRQPASAASHTSPPLGALPVDGFVKPEVVTPLIDRTSRPSGSSNVSTHGQPRREQSLDYEPIPTTQNVAMSHAASIHRPSASTGAPTAQSGSTAKSSGSFPQMLATALLPPPSARPDTTHVARTSYPTVTLGGPSMRIPSPPSPPTLPDLAYPSRDETPALIISTLADYDDPMGLGIIHPDDTGIAPQVGRVSPEPSPPTRQNIHTRPEAAGRNTRAPELPLPIQSLATNPEEVDHWSPPPNRPVPHRERYSPPVRHKRTREEEEVLENRTRRARLAGPSGNRARTPPRNPAPVPAPRRASGQQDRSRLPPRSRSRSRSASPDRAREDDRSYRPRPRSRSRSPPYTTYYQSYTRGLPTNGYAPPPPPAAAHPESEVRFPQVAPASPAADPDGGHVPAAGGPARRAKQRMAPPAVAPVPAESAAPTAARRQVLGRASPVEVPVKVSLLNRIHFTPVEDDESSTSTAATPVKQRKVVAKSPRGGGAASGSTPTRGGRGGRGGNPSARGRGALARGGGHFETTRDGGVSSTRGSGEHVARRGRGKGHLSLVDRMGLGPEDMV
ncbi:hypothetical protein C2E23DRAFT_899165 [Lenzites betulinus]|nr:hypothetical protein C2E23DRAFT_899165 [Lenzites betulinus]